MLSTGEPDTPQERAGLVVWHLAHGEGMTTCQVASLTGKSERAARKMMLGLCRVLPICRENGIWQALFLDEMAKVI